MNTLISELEGKEYIENYIQTLTHEIKSPLSGIRAGAELLQGNLPPEEEKRFLSNILKTFRHYL